LYLNFCELRKPHDPSTTAVPSLSKPLNRAIQSGRWILEKGFIPPQTKNRPPNSRGKCTKERYAKLRKIPAVL
jgi:hypothetical protein